MMAQQQDFVNTFQMTYLLLFVSDGNNSREKGASVAYEKGDKKDFADYILTSLFHFI